MFEYIYIYNFIIMIIIIYNFVVFHQYFHEVDEAEYWMQTTLSRIHLSFNRKQLTGDKADVESIQTEMKVSQCLYE